MSGVSIFPFYWRFKPAFVKSVPVFTAPAALGPWAACKTFLIWGRRPPLRRSSFSPRPGSSRDFGRWAPSPSGETDRSPRHTPGRYRPGRPRGWGWSGIRSRGRGNPRPPLGAPSSPLPLHFQPWEETASFLCSQLSSSHFFQHCSDVSIQAYALCPDGLRGPGLPLVDTDIPRR